VPACPGTRRLALSERGPCAFGDSFFGLVTAGARDAVARQANHWPKNVAPLLRGVTIIGAAAFIDEDP
jgi:uncharacterized membrane protein YedE/YeeE